MEGKMTDLIEGTLEKARAAIATHDLVAPDAAVLLMVSGGSDSTALAYLGAALREAGDVGPVAMLHVNHQLRGEDADADERFVAALAEALDIPLFICSIDIAAEAERKAGAVIQEVLAENYTGMLIVIGADTMVVLDGKIFGKPRSASDGKHMLRQLSGRTHEVITAVSVWMVAAPNAEDVSLGFRTFADISRVTFRDLTDEEITEYLRKGESFDKAGAYAIQGEGASLVDHYDGSLDTIIGLPAMRLIKEFPDLVNAEAAEC